MPTPSTGDIWRDVIRDMEERRDVGIERYGTPLQPFNGRRPEVDLYQELLDASVYAKQLCVELAHLRALVEAYREKRKWDGHRCRPWNAIKHYETEDRIEKLEGEC